MEKWNTENIHKYFMTDFELGFWNKVIKLNWIDPYCEGIDWGRVAFIYFLGLQKSDHEKNIVF